MAGNEQFTPGIPEEQFDNGVPQIGGPGDPIPAAKKTQDYLEAKKFFDNSLATSFFTRNENLVTQYRSVPGANTEKYLNAEAGFSPLIDNEDYYAQTQSGLEKIGKGLLKLPLYTVTKLGAGIGFVGSMVNPVNWFSDEGYISSVADNSISTFFDSWEQDIKNQWLPTFQEAKDRDKGFFARAATDIDFWTEDFVDGAAFMASAWIPGMALSKLGLGAKAINGLAKLGMATEGAGSVAGTVEAVGATTNYFKNAAKYAQGLDKFNAWAIATSSEAMFEAKGVKDAIMLSLENSSLTEDQKKHVAGENARNAFLMNAALLGVTNLFELPLVSKMLGRTEGVARGITGGAKLGEDVAVKEATSKVGKLLDSGYGRFAKDATKGIFREGFIEENGQLAIQRFNEQYGAAGKIANMLDFETYSDLGEQYISQTKAALSGEDKEASTSIGLGGILGGGMTAIGNARQAPKNKLTTEQAVDYYNKAQESWLKFGNIYQTEQVTSKDDNGNDVVTEKIKLDQNNQPIMDKQKLAGVVSSVRANAAAIDLTESDTNMSRRNLMRDNAFADFVMAHINANMEDTLIQKLDAAAKSSPEDLAKLGFVADGTLQEQIGRYKALATTIIKQNKIINNDIMFDGSKEDMARKNRLTELAAKQAVFRGLAAEEQKKFEEIRNEITTSDNSSLSDGLVDQLNTLQLRIKSQEQYIRELKAGPESLTKSQVKVAEELLTTLKDQLEDLKKNNDLSVKKLKTFNNGLYQYEKEARNNAAYINPMIRRMKYKGELDNHIGLLGQEWGYYADFVDGKKNFLDMFIEEQVKAPVNQNIDQENKQANQPTTPPTGPATPPPGPQPGGQPSTPAANQPLDESVSYSYQGQVYNIMQLGDAVIMMNVKSPDEKDNVILTEDEFKKAMTDGKISVVKPPQSPGVQPTSSTPAPPARTYPDDLETFLQQEYETVKKAATAQGKKLLPYAEWKQTAGVGLTKLWMSKKGQQQQPSTPAEQTPTATEQQQTSENDIEAKKAALEEEEVDTIQEVQTRLNEDLGVTSKISIDAHLNGLHYVQTEDGKYYVIPDSNASGYEGVSAKEVTKDQIIKPFRTEAEWKKVGIGLAALQPTAPVSDIEAKRKEVRAAIQKAGQGEGGQFFVTLADGTKESAARISLSGNELGVGNKGVTVDLSTIVKIENPDGSVVYDSTLEGAKPASTYEKEIEDLKEQLNKDLGSARELRFMSVGSIGYDKDGNKYQIVSKKDKYGRSLEYRKNDGAEQSFNPKTASTNVNDVSFYPEAFVKLYSKNPKPILDKYGKDLIAIETKYAQMQAQQGQGQQEQQQEEDTSKDVKDYVQDINQYRTQSNQNNALANAEYQEGLRQTAPSNSLANTTDIVNVVEFAPNQVRYERGEVNKNYVFDVATSTFMPGYRVTFKVMVDGFEPVVNRLTGEKYDKSTLYDENWNAVQGKYDFIPIAVFANIRGKEVMIGTIHEPQWIEYKIGEKYPHIAIPEDQVDQPVPDVVKEEVRKNRELRKLILDSYNQNHNFVIEGVVEDKSMGMLRTTESVEPISKRVNPRIAEGGTDNRHGMFAIVRDGSIQSDRNVVIDNIVPTESFSPQNIVNYQGVAVLMLPTPTGQLFPSFIKLPNVSVDQAEFIIEAWKAFTGQTNNPEIVKAVYDAMGLIQSPGDFAVGILRDYIDHYITQVDGNRISRTGNGMDVRPGSARLNITNKGGLELQVKDSNGEWYATDQPIMKAENLPVDYLSKMSNLKTTVKFSNVKNDALKGINSTEKATILSIKNGKLVKENIMYNQYIMDRAGTFVDKGIQSKNPFGDWVYFANPVVKMTVAGPTDPNEGQLSAKQDVPAPTVEQVNTPREDKGAALLAALKAKKLKEDQVEEQKKNCSSLRSKLNNIM